MHVHYLVLRKSCTHSCTAWQALKRSFAFLSRLKLPSPKLPFSSLSNACHAGYSCTHLRIYRSLWQFSKETRTRNSHTYKFQIPFSSKNTPKFSFFPRTSREWSVLPAAVVLSLSQLCSRRK